MVDNFVFNRILKGDGFFVEIDCVDFNIVKFRIHHDKSFDAAKEWFYRPVNQFIPLARFWGIQNNHG
jgi:hypothetical protein